MGATSSSLTLKRRRTGERVIKGALLACGVVSIAITAGIILTLIFETVEFLRRVPILDFLTGTNWAPTFKPPSYGVLPLVTATLLIAGIASLVAFPLGLGAAIYLSEYASRRVRKYLKPALEILAGIPTVVLGYFALTFLTPSILRKIVPWLDGSPLGPFNALSAGIAVGIAIIPIVASISEDALRAVPYSLREAAFGIGATKRTVSTKVVVPGALSGIAAAFILGLSRAIGETMIVAIAGGASARLSGDPRHAMEPITAFIVRISQGDNPQTTTAYKTIFALGMLLFLMTFGLNLIATRIVRRFREQYE